MRPGLIALTAAAVLTGACTPPAPPSPIPAPVPAPVPAPRMQAVTVLAPASPREVGLDAGLAAQLDSIGQAAVADRAAPAIAIAVGRHGRLVHLRGYGTVDWAPGSAPVTDS